MRKGRIVTSLMALGLLMGCNANADIGMGELVKGLENDEFTLRAQSSTTYGLSDPNNVGVDKEKFENERLYGSEGKEFDLVLDATEFGVSGTDSHDDTIPFASVIAEAKRHEGERIKIVLPSGDLDFIAEANPVDSTSGISLRGLKHVTISGHNTNVWFHGDIKGFDIQDCEDLTIEDINIDWGKTPFSMGTILETDGRTFKVKVNDGYTVDENTNVLSLMEFNKTTKLPRTRGNCIYWDVSSINYLGDNTLSIKYQSQHATAPVGTIVVLRHYLYEHDCFFVQRCKDVKLETVRVYACPGMGMRAYSTENIYLNRFNCELKPGTDRLCTACADMVHTIDCLGDLKITNCLHENCGDDSTNVHGAFLQINSIEGPKSLKATNPKGYNFQPQVGDELEVRTTTNIGLIQVLHVTSSSKMANGGFELSLEEDLNGVQIGQVIANRTRSPKLVYSNNVVRNKRCRGILVQTRHAEISNNTFANLQDAGILLTADAGDWFESLPASDVLIKNNKFLKLNYGQGGGSSGDIAICPFGAGYNVGDAGTCNDITIDNNFFSGGANCAMHLQSTKNLKVRHNLIGSCALSPKSPIFNAGIHLGYDEDVELISNSVYKNSSADFKAVQVGASLNAETVRVAGNNGFNENNISSVAATVNTVIAKTTQNLSKTGLSFDGWDTLTELSINGIADTDLVEKAFDDATFKINHLVAGYDDDGLYVGFDIFDQAVQYSATESFWEGDGVEIFISAETETQDPLSVLKLTDPTCLELFMSGNATTGNKVVALRTSQNIIDSADQISMSWAEKDDGKGYVGKAFIPFSLIPAYQQKLTSGQKVALCVNFNDLDGDGNPRVQYATCYNQVEYNKTVPGKMSTITDREVEE